jgi:hypothetical protein
VGTTTIVCELGGAGGGGAMLDFEGKRGGGRGGLHPLPIKELEPLA